MSNIIMSFLLGLMALVIFSFMSLLLFIIITHAPKVLAITFIIAVIIVYSYSIGKDIKKDL
jgi:hypothetical protein